MASKPIQSKWAPTLGFSALVLVTVLGYAGLRDDGTLGWSTSQVGRFIALLPYEPPVETTLRSVGPFDIYEENLRRALFIAAVVLASLAPGLAYLAARRETFSLWYSLAVLSASTALGAKHGVLRLGAMVVRALWIGVYRWGRLVPA